MDQIRYKVYTARVEGETFSIVYGYHENVDALLVSISY